jgi:hypothetical protein
MLSVVESRLFWKARDNLDDALILRDVKAIVVGLGVAPTPIDKAKSARGKANNMAD